jgi:hypothetical protein
MRSQGLGAVLGGSRWEGKGFAAATSGRQRHAIGVGVEVCKKSGSHTVCTTVVESLVEPCSIVWQPVA